MFLKTAAAALTVAVIGGALWATFQIFVRIQLPYVFGVGLAWLCGLTIDKVSQGSTGALYILHAFGCVLLGWLIGIFGVVLGGYFPLIGIRTIACFVLAPGVAWKAATQ